MPLRVTDGKPRSPSASSPAESSASSCKSAESTDPHGSRTVAAGPSLVARIIRRLEGAFGRQVWRRWGDGLEELVGTILSQNTSNINSGRAYECLERMFARDSKQIDWNAVADAPVARLEKAIRCAGLSRMKSRRIRNILRAIRAERGELSLEFLADWPVDKARNYLTRFEGVGPKTAACILLFSFRQPILPVDTHIHRIAIRLALIGPKVSAEASHAALEAIVPRREFYNFHILLIKHGRQICKAHRPRCHDCPLLSLCPTGPTLIRQGRAAASVK
ncbi:MAG: endonuclease III [Phycisphaerae bacterium]|nr:endonuclease III [Phycisphaerae bacterium]